ncbi:MAG: putative nuclease of the RNAse H fold, HicB family [Verrucomicrobia bacterium]|jgi:predicted RNase H-like HicB family nuclease|nr:MAG: putative nuclease of the RNAse H fold, HicB family [Verrucomicrobiota bacterium]
MHGEFTAVVSRSEDGAYVASCAEIPGIVAEAESEAEAIANLSDSIAIAFEVNRDEAFREAEPGSRCLTVKVDHTPETLGSEALTV